MALSEPQRAFLFSTNGRAPAAAPAAAGTERKRGKRPKSARKYAALESTANGAAGKASVSRPPAAARGASFSGPTVSSESFTLGEPVAAAMLRLRAEER